MATSQSAQKNIYRGKNDGKLKISYFEV